MAYRLRNTETNNVVDVWGVPPGKLSVPNVGDVHGVSSGWSGGNYVFEEFSEPPAPIQIDSYSVNAERDRRLRSFSFAGKAFQFDADSKSNVAGAGTLALAAIINGAQPGNLRWADANRDFTWLASDNTVVTMDAQTTFAFAQAAAKWVSDHIYAARAIKDISPIPSDYAADARWPS